MTEDVIFLAANPTTAIKGTKAILVDRVHLLYSLDIFPNSRQEIQEVRVGGIPWRKVTENPSQGEWSIVGDKIQLGSPTLGGTVRYDITRDG